MPQTLGLGAFTEGLQGGIAARDKRDLNRQYERILSDRADMADFKWDADVGALRENYILEQGSAEGFTAPQRTQLQDPALIRFGKWLGSRMGFGQQTEEQGAIEGASFASPEIQPAGRQQSGATTYGIPGYAHGGRVVSDEDRKRYAGMADEAVGKGGGGGLGRFLTEDMPRHAGAVFDDTRRSALEGDKDVQESYDALRGSESAREAGGAFTDWAKASARTAGATAIGVAKDVFVDNPIGQFAAGALGFDGQESAIPETTDAGQGKATGDKGAAIKSAIDVPDKSDEQIAQQAMSEGQQAAIENFDYQLLADQGVSPDELPSMTTRDWSDYRTAIFRREIAQGRTAKEAAQATDYLTVDSQMRGMMRELDKAVMYLGTGQNQAAAMAVRQGFQYFPNGIDVKFGTTTDPTTGQPAIIAIGRDEETGEPTGKPMLITTERLSTMRENFSKPEAFRAWTKDGHDLQLEVNKLESLDDYRQGSLDISAYRAETSRAGALSGKTGLKPSDRDRRDDIYRERLEMLGLDDERTADSLARAMSIYEQATGTDTTGAVEAVMEAYSTGDFQGVQDLLDSLGRP